VNGSNTFLCGAQGRITSLLKKGYASSPFLFPFKGVTKKERRNPRPFHSKNPLWGERRGRVRGRSKEGFAELRRTSKDLPVRRNPSKNQREGFEESRTSKGEVNRSLFLNLMN